MTTAKYFPSLTVRQSEAEALRRLAEPIKDVIFPVVRVQAWPHPKSGEGGPVQRSTDHVADAWGARKIGVDLAAPPTPSDRVYKTQARADWAALGRSEVAALHDPANGYQAWCSFIASDQRRIPVVQWDDNPFTLRSQVQQLAALNRGLIFRFRRSRGWNLAQAAALVDLPLGETPVLMIYDCEQIGLKDDLTSMGVIAQGAMLMSNTQVSGGTRTHVFKGSSFPSEFVTTGEDYACLTIRERQLFDMLRSSPPIITAGIDLNYGDHAAVFASDREPASAAYPGLTTPWQANGFITAAARDFTTLRVACEQMRNGMIQTSAGALNGSERPRTAKWMASILLVGGQQYA